MKLRTVLSEISIDQVVVWLIFRLRLTHSLIHLIGQGQEKQATKVENKRKLFPLKISIMLRFVIHQSCSIKWNKQEQPFKHLRVWIIIKVMTSILKLIKLLRWEATKEWAQIPTLNNKQLNQNQTTLAPSKPSLCSNSKNTYNNSKLKC